MNAHDWARSLPACIVRRAFQDTVLVPAVRAFCGVRGEGSGGLHGPLLIVANHASHLDTPAILAALPAPIRHRTAVAAAADYFYRSRLLGTAASLGIGTFAFARRGRDGTTSAAALLAQGWNVLLFPQGSRGGDASWQPFRAGVGHLLAATGVAALPVGVCGTRTLWPRGQRLPHRGSVEVHFGQVWKPEPHQCPSAICAELERRVKELVPR